MTITVTTLEAGPFTATGASQEVAFAFKVFSSAEIEVVDADGEIIVSPDDYAVESNAAVGGAILEGGTVTLGAGALDAATTFYLRARPYEGQDQVFSSAGTRLENLNEGLDRVSLQVLRQRLDLEAGLTGAQGAATAAVEARDAAIAAMADKQDRLLPALEEGYPVQTVEAAFDERVGIGRLVPGFDPDGGDNTAVLQTAVERAIARGVGLILPPSLSEISEAIVIEGALPIVGSGGRAQFRRMAAANAVFTAENLDEGPSYHNLGFINDPLAPAYVHDEDGVTEDFGRFVQHTRVHGVRARDIVLDGRNGDGKSGIFAAFQNLYGDDEDIIGLRAYGILGNVCGPNGDGAGEGGRRWRGSHIYIFDSGDTGVGFWTGADDGVLDQFYIGPISVADDAEMAPYTKVAIDCAGATNIRIGRGTIKGGTIAVRIASNVVGGGAATYHNDHIHLSDGLVLDTQEASTRSPNPEPGKGVFINHTGATILRFTDRARHVVSGQNGINGYATNVAGTLEIDIDKARFEGTGLAYNFRGNEASPGNGKLRFRPGTAQTQDFNAAGGAVTTANGTWAGSVTVDDLRQNVIVDIGDGQRDFVSFNNTSTANKLVVENLRAGYYRIQIETGAMSDAAGGVTLTHLEGTAAISAANANSKLEFFVTLTIDYSLYEISYTSTAGGNNYAFKRVTIQKLT